MKYIVFYNLFLMSESAFGRSLKATADKLATDTGKIVASIGLFGLLMASAYMILGRNDAHEKMTKVLMGLCVCMTAPAILNFIRGLA